MKNFPWAMDAFYIQSLVKQMNFIIPSCIYKCYNTWLLKIGKLCPKQHKVVAITFCENLWWDAIPQKPPYFVSLLIILESSSNFQRRNHKTIMKDQQTILKRKKKKKVFCHYLKTSYVNNQAKDSLFFITQH